MLKPVLCFHMKSLNYDAKGVRDIDPALVFGGILLLGLGCGSLNQYNLQDRMLRLNSNLTRY